MFTRDNHFNFFYSPDSKEPNFGFRVGSTGPHLPFAKQVLKNLEEILVAHGSSSGTLTVPFSGGLDSEFLIRVALALGLKVRPIFVRFQMDLNMACRRRATETAQALGLELTEIDLDILNFFESGEYLKYCQLANCHSPQIAMHLWLLDQIDDSLLILPGQVPAVHMKCPALMTKLETWAADDEPCYFEGRNTFLQSNGIQSFREIFHALPEYVTSWATTCQDPSYCRYFQKRARDGVPQFFLFTPELIAASLQQWRFFHAQDSFQMFTQNTKHRLYSSVFPHMAFFEKRTGFEGVKAHFRQRGVQFDKLFRLPLQRAAPESHSHLLVSLHTLDSMLTAPPPHDVRA